MQPSIITAVGMVLTLTMVTSVKGVEVRFTEVDYAVRESDGVSTVMIWKIGVHSSPLEVTVTSLTYQQYEDRGLTLGSELAGRTLPDPAEGSDFTPVEQTVSFTPTDSFETIQVNIPIIDDAVNEADEGFLVILELKSDPGSVTITRRESLVMIRDNDTISLSFEHPSYTLSEDDGLVDDAIKVVKANGVVSEQTFRIILSKEDLTATEGLDYFTQQLPRIITVRPEDQAVDIPVVVLNDLISEETEQFKLTLSIPPLTAGYFVTPHSSTIVHITDNNVPAGVYVGFTEVDYAVREGDGMSTVMIWKKGVHSSPLEVTVTSMTYQQYEDRGLTLGSELAGRTPPDPAEGSDFIPVELTVSFTPTDEVIQVNIPIIDDVVNEPDEGFLVILELTNDPGSVIITRRESLVMIRDNDYAPAPVNECSTGQHDCDANARCIVTQDGYRCKCKKGFKGDGRTCTGVQAST